MQEQGNLQKLFGAAGFKAQEMLIVEDPPEVQFRDALEAIGCTVDTVVADGKNHRINGRDDKKRSVSYVLCQFGDIWAGSFIDWREGYHHAWRSTGNRPMSWAERREIDVKMAEIRRRSEEEKKRWQDEAAEMAEEALSSCAPASNDHPYLIKKRVKSHGLLQREDELLVPMVNGDGRTVRGYQSMWARAMQPVPPSSRPLAVSATSRSAQTTCQTWPDTPRRLTRRRGW
jgi:phage/plasmid primase-like uncharacterized protein